MDYRSRADWGAKNPSTPLTPIGQVDTVFIHHSAGPYTSDPNKDVRLIQQFHMGTRHYTDIAYTLLAHPSGVVLEGRTVGLKAAQGAHTSGYNSKAIAICAIGNYQESEATDLLIKTINEALGYAISKGWCVSKPRIRPHSDVASTACCGSNLKKRLDEIGTGVTPAPIPDKPVIGVPVKEFETFYTSVKTDGQGRGYVDVFHNKGKDPVSKTVSVNGGFSKTKGYPDSTPYFWPEALENKYVRVTVIGAKPNDEFGFNVLMGWE